MSYVTQFDKPEHFSVQSLSSYLGNNPSPLDSCGFQGALSNFNKEGPTSYGRDGTQAHMVCLTTSSPSAQDITDFQSLLDVQISRKHLLDTAMKRVDDRTAELFSLGFRYTDGVLHSMSQNAQRTFLGMFVSSDIMEAEGLFVEPFPISSLDNGSYTILKSKGDLVAFYKGIITAVSTYKHGGTLIKRSLAALSDVELAAYTDPRPLAPVQV